MIWAQGKKRKPPVQVYDELRKLVNENPHAFDGPWLTWLKNKLEMSDIILEGSGGDQKIIEEENVEVGREPALSFNDTARIALTVTNTPGTRDIVKAYTTFVNPGDVIIDPDLIDCTDVHADFDAFVLTSDNDTNSPIPTASIANAGSNGAWQAGFELQIRVITAMGGNISNLIAQTDQGQVVLGVWAAGESPATYDSGWIDANQDRSALVCGDAVTVGLTFTPHNLFTGSSVGAGELYTRWVYQPTGAGSGPGIVNGDVAEQAKIRWYKTSLLAAAKSADYQITKTDDLITMDATGAARTATLPDPNSDASLPGYIFVLKKIDASANTVTLSRSTSGGDTIDGSTTKVLTEQWEEIAVVCVGVNWRILWWYRPSVISGSGDLAAHIADTTDAHDASAISYLGGTDVSATDVEGALDELSTEKLDAADLEAEFTWATYNPTWTASPTPPAIGNGTITGRYIQIGKLVHARVRIDFGTTTTFGSGAYNVSLPVTPRSGHFQPGAGLFYDDSGTATYFAFWRADGYIMTGSTGAGAAGFFTESAPVTWNDPDFMELNIIYEAA